MYILLVVCLFIKKKFILDVSFNKMYKLVQTAEHMCCKDGFNFHSSLNKDSLGQSKAQTAKLH